MRNKNVKIQYWILVYVYNCMYNNDTIQVPRGVQILKNIYCHTVISILKLNTTLVYDILYLLLCYGTIFPSPINQGTVTGSVSAI